jgi:hypothetical protein
VDQKGLSFFKDGQDVFRRLAGMPIPIELCDNRALPIETPFALQGISAGEAQFLNQFSMRHIGLDRAATGEA